VRIVHFFGLVKELTRCSRRILTKSRCKAASLSVLRSISCWSNLPSRHCTCMVQDKLQGECTRRLFLLTARRHLRTKFRNRFELEQSRLSNTSALDHDLAPIRRGIMHPHVVCRAAVWYSSRTASAAREAFLHENCTSCT